MIDRQQDEERETVQFEEAEPAAPRPVFVDSTGRRGRRVRATFWVLGTLMAAYVATVVLSLVGPPGLSRLTVPGVGPVLPGPWAPQLSTGGGRHERVARVLTSPTPAGSAGPVAGSTPTAQATSGSGAISPTPVPSRTAGPSPAPSPSPTPRRSPGRPSPAPSAGPTSSSPRATPPGQSGSHPTPRSTRAAHASPSPSP